jgi:predicted nucleotidyltransferase
MIRESDRLLDQMVQAIVNEVDPEQVILFGSRASGTPTEDSDVDLVVVESAPFNGGRSRRREMTRLWRILAPFNIAKDILVYSSDEVERWRHSLNHVLARAQREGRVLYERP